MSRPTHDPDPFARRRQRALEALGDDAALVLPAAPEIRVGRDTELRYIPDPDLFYLTGHEEPEAVAVLAPGTDAPFTMFVRERDPDRELWTGPRGGTDAATDRLGADAAFPMGELEERLPKLLKHADRVFFRVRSGRPDVERIILDALADGRAGRQRTGRGPRHLIDAGAILDDMRIIKEPYEIEAIREAVRITVAGFRDALQAAHDGAGEWEVEAAIEAAFRRAGARGPAFPTIAASGPNATVLHHIGNDRVMHDGELLLIDAGARVGAYNGDITRTIAVDGPAAGGGGDVREIVIQANRAAMEAVRPGATIMDVHRAATRVLARGMVDLRLLQGSADDIAHDDERLKKYYPHRTSHWLGLDVHDVGDYVRDGQPRRLEPGMVLTIEPGLYIPAHDHDAPTHLRGIGVRIEDDALVTPHGAEVLSADLPH